MIPLGRFLAKDCDDHTKSDCNRENHHVHPEHITHVKHSMARWPNQNRIFGHQIDSLDGTEDFA